MNSNPDAEWTKLVRPTAKTPWKQDTHARALFIGIDGLYKSLEQTMDPKNPELAHDLPADSTIGGVDPLMPSTTWQPSDDLLIAMDTQVNFFNTVAVFQKFKEVSLDEIPNGSAFRISYEVQQASSGFLAYSEVRRNGVRVGTTNGCYCTSWQTISQDVSGWNKGDLLQWWGYRVNDDTPLVRNFRVHGRLGFAYTINAD